MDQTDIDRTAESVAAELEEARAENARLRRLLEDRARDVTVKADVTERERADEALRSSEARYRSLFAGARDGIALVSPDGVLVDANEAFARMHGYAVEELRGRPLRTLDTPAIAPLVPERVRRVLAGEMLSFETEHLHRSGHAFAIEVTASTVVIDGRPCVLAFHRDISDRKRAEAEKARLEAQLHQAQKLESVGRLAGGVAHDFNNMLAVILANTEVAMEQVDPALPLLADLEEIQQAALRSADLTRQLLAFARKQTILPKVLDLNETVTGMMKMLQRLIGENITLCWRPAAKLWSVNVDPGQVDQILANLCVNARDAISSVGTLTLATGTRTFLESDRARCAEAVPGDYVWLAVTDDGCGMTEETVTHVFEPFFTTKAVGEGTGLGLATVFGIVKQNDGFIDVRSQPGAGSTFTIYLPRHTGAAELASDGAPLPVARGSETILLVEDEAAVLRATARMLEAMGYRVLRARTPGEARRLAGERSAEIHLLITDLVMPEMNGLDLANELSSACPGMKHLLMSGYTAEVIAKNGVLDGAVRFLQKPFSRRGLAATVREALDGA